MTTDVEQLIEERRRTHGDFAQNSVTMQDLKHIIRSTPNWPNMPAPMRETLDMIAHKIGRIGHGDPFFPDHWRDIEGYVRRVIETLPIIETKPVNAAEDE